MEPHYTVCGFKSNGKAIATMHIYSCTWEVYFHNSGANWGRSGILRMNFNKDLTLGPQFHGINGLYFGCIYSFCECKAYIMKVPNSYFSSKKIPNLAGSPCSKGKIRIGKPGQPHGLVMLNFQRQYRYSSQLQMNQVRVSLQEFSHSPVCNYSHEGIQVLVYQWISREQVIEGQSPGNISLHLILTDPKNLSALSSFINATGHLKQTLGIIPLWSLTTGDEE
ncbi:hypothetical protein BDQ17DRAFT_1336729 [Cyathus striatus]|nr:hypothetical protein BDQ17DRAFT_1336729 [Cyathus striatus]